MKTTVTAVIGCGLISLHMGVAQAAVSADEARKLGSTLTPFGAEKAGNKDGSIPEYTGGLTTAPAGYDKAKGVRPDPFAAEKPLASIDGKNLDRYADRLTEGTKALIKANNGFRIDIYPTHRTVAFPKFVLDNTVKNATRARLSEDGQSMLGAKAGIPFPIPKNGNEVMFNFLARYQGVSYSMPRYSAYNVGSNGRAVLSTQGQWVTESPYYDESREPTLLTRTKANYTAPARRAGEAIMSLENIESAKGRRAYQYLPGQRRVRLAPDLAYDTPNASTVGMSTYDDVNLFNGKLDRYDWQLVGKKEMYVPYNTYRFSYAENPDEVFQPKFVSPDLVRWELHRVWVVEAKLKEGQRHIYSRRTYYVDEDSWYALAVDQYDGRGQLWRPGFAYLNWGYDVMAPIASAGHYDVIAGTYYMNLWPSVHGAKVADTLQPETQWTPDALAGQGVR